MIFFRKKSQHLFRLKKLFQLIFCVEGRQTPLSNSKSGKCHGRDRLLVPDLGGGDVFF